MSDHRAVVRWQESMTFETISDGKAHLSLPLTSGFLDEAEGEKGFSPMGLVLAGLAGCTAMDVVSILSKKRQKVTFLEVEVEGNQAKEHPRVYTDVTIVYRLGGEDLSTSAVERAIELSVTKYCPVNAMLKDIATVEHRYEIVDAEQ